MRNQTWQANWRRRSIVFFAALGSPILVFVSLTGCNRSSVDVNKDRGRAVLTVQSAAPDSQSGDRSPALGARKGTPGEYELGAPIYPGAVPLTNGGSLGHYGRDASGLVSALFLTSDDQQRVADFYEDKLSVNGVKPQKTEWNQGERHAVVYSITTPRATVTVGIHVQEDKTAIEIMNIPSSMIRGASVPIAPHAKSSEPRRLDQMGVDSQ